MKRLRKSPKIPAWLLLITGSSRKAAAIFRLYSNSQSKAKKASPAQKQGFSPNGDSVPNDGQQQTSQNRLHPVAEAILRTPRRSSSKPMSLSEQRSKIAAALYHRAFDLSQRLSVRPLTPPSFHGPLESGRLTLKSLSPIIRKSQAKLSFKKQARQASKGQGEHEKYRQSNIP